jgi:hypothetical protein
VACAIGTCLFTSSVQSYSQQLAAEAAWTAETTEREERRARAVPQARQAAGERPLPAAPEARPVQVAPLGSRVPVLPQRAAAHALRPRAAPRTSAMLRTAPGVTTLDLTAARPHSVVRTRRGASLGPTPRSAALRHFRPIAHRRAPVTPPPTAEPSRGWERATCSIHNPPFLKQRWCLTPTIEPTTFCPARAAVCTSRPVRWWAARWSSEPLIQAVNVAQTSYVSPVPRSHKSMGRSNGGPLPACPY